MSILDKVIGAVTPPESDEKRAEARAEARKLAEADDWLSIILDQHEELEAALASVRDSTSATERTEALRDLGILLTGHSIAEEAVIYPALAEAGEKGHAVTGYTEQSAAKMQMAGLEKLDPLSEDFDDKLSHLEGAVLHHMYAEEANWFPDLKKKASAADQLRMKLRFTEEYERYINSDF